MGGGELQVARKLFTSHSKLFKVRQLCFFGRGRSGWVRREVAAEEEVGRTRTNCH